MNEKHNRFRQRDVATLRVLGIFFCIMGGLVLVASYEAIGNLPALIVNLCSGLAIGAVGVGMIMIASRMRRNDGNR